MYDGWELHHNDKSLISYSKQATKELDDILQADKKQ